MVETMDVYYNLGLEFMPAPQYLSLFSQRLSTELGKPGGWTLQRLALYTWTSREHSFEETDTVISLANAIIGAIKRTCDSNHVKFVRKEISRDKYESRGQHGKVTLFGSDSPRE